MPENTGALRILEGSQQKPEPSLIKFNGPECSVYDSVTGLIFHTYIFLRASRFHALTSSNFPSYLKQHVCRVNFAEVALLCMTKGCFQELWNTALVMRRCSTAVSTI